MKTMHQKLLAFIAISTFPGALFCQSISWQQTSGPPNAEVSDIAGGRDGVIYVATTAGAFSSTDRGGTWLKILDGEVSSVVWHPSGRVYAGTLGSGILSSSDNGTTWIPTGADSDTVWTISIDHDGRLFAGSNGYVLIAEQAGALWTRVPFTDVEVFSVAFKPGGNVFAATYGKGVFASSDYGRTWTQTSSGLDTMYVQHLAVAPGGDLYLATNCGVFTSTNNGLQWTRSSPNWNVAVHKMAVTHAGIVFAAAHNGIYESTDKGQTWVQQNGGLTNTTIGALLVANDGFVYAGTWGSGVFKSNTTPDPFVYDWLSGEKPGDAFGTTVASLGDVNGDGWADFAVAAPHSDERGPNTGSVRIYFGGGVPSEGSSLFLHGNAMYDYFGSSVAGPGDINADGYCDIVIGAPTDYNPWVEYKSPDGIGHAYVYFGGPSMDAVPDLVLSGANGMGSSVASPGDVNADGIPDLLVTAGLAPDPDGSPAKGRSFVLLGGSPLNPKPYVSMGDRGWGVGFGRYTNGAGDIDGDGYDDIAIHRSMSDIGLQSRDLLVFRGGAPMDSNAAALIHGTGIDGWQFACSFSGGDFNGDGRTDLIVARPDETMNTGAPMQARSEIYMGGLPYESNRNSSIWSPSRGIGYALFVISLGDINHDGFDDLLVGAPNDSGSGARAGSAYLYLGGAPFDTLSDHRIPGTMSYDQVGSTASTCRDFDGDGRLEILLGCPGNDPGGSFSGRVYLYEPPLAVPVIPAVPRLVWPSDDARHLALTVPLRWSKASSARTYHVQLSKDPLFQTVLLENTTLADTTFFIGSLDSSSIYYWRVRAANPAAVSSWSGAWRFSTLPEFPGSVQLLSPAHRSFSLPGDVAVHWYRATPDVDHYRLEVGLDSTFAGSTTDSTLTDTTGTLSGLPDGRSTWWRVGAHNSTGWGPYSDAWQLTSVSRPGPIGLVAPANDEVFSSSIVTLVWHRGGPFVTRYSLEVSADSLFPGGMMDSTVTDTLRTRTDLSGNTRYWWRVRGWNGSGWGAYSEVRSFTLLAFPSAVELHLPTSGSSIVPGPVRFSWLTAQPLVTRYWFEMATDSNFTFRTSDSSVIDTSKTMLGLSPGGTYWWRVRARNATGWGPFSQSRRLQILTPPGAVELVSPPDRWKALTGVVDFVWKRAAPAIDRYWFEIASDSLFTFAASDTAVADTLKTMKGLASPATYWWRVRAHNPVAWGASSETRQLTVSTSSVSDLTGVIPTQYVLEQNYPNPFNPTTSIRYGLPRQSEVSIMVFNMLGQMVAVLVQQEQPAGYHEVRFDASTIPSGMYLYRIQAGTYVATRKLIFVR
jgi:hypothetical protein